MFDYLFGEYESALTKNKCFGNSYKEATEAGMSLKHDDILQHQSLVPAKSLKDVSSTELTALLFDRMLKEVNAGNSNKEG